MELPSTPAAVRGLEAPQSYLDATQEERDFAVNTCGPEGAAHLVPDKVFGADFSGACRIHDWDYTMGLEDRSAVDRRFLRNLTAAASRAPWLLRPFAWLAARWYYRAVRIGGGAFYGNA